MTLTREQFLNQKRDFTNYLVHLTKSREDAVAWEVLVEILVTGSIEARGPHGLFTPKLGTVTDSWCKRQFRVACFSASPIEFIADLVKPVEGRQVQLEPYGVCVGKEMVRSAHGSPTLYVSGRRSWGANKLFDHLVESERWDLLHDVFPFMSKIDEGYDFHWEREWRVPGGLPITPEIALLVVCEERHIDSVKGALRLDGGAKDWLDVPFVDAAWRPERIVAEIGWV